MELETPAPAVRSHQHAVHQDQDDVKLVREANAVTSKLNSCLGSAGGGHEDGHRAASAIQAACPEAEQRIDRRLADAPLPASTNRMSQTPQFHRHLHQKDY